MNGGWERMRIEAYRMSGKERYAVEKDAGPNCRSKLQDISIRVHRKAEQRRTIQVPTCAITAVPCVSVSK